MWHGSGAQRLFGRRGRGADRCGAFCWAEVEGKITFLRPGTGADRECRLIAILTQDDGGGGVGIVGGVDGAAHVFSARLEDRLKHGRSVEEAIGEKAGWI